MNSIKAIRTRLGLTQAALAEGIGCTQGNVGHYENKGQTVPPDVARRLISFANELGVALTFDDVYGPAKTSPQHTAHRPAGTQLKPSHSVPPAKPVRVKAEAAVQCGAARGGVHG